MDLVLDIETQGLGTSQRRPEITCAAAGEVRSIAPPRVFESSQLDILRSYLEEAERIVGFGIQNFDLPILFGSQPWPFTVVDLLEDIRGLTGHRVSLQSLSLATLGEGRRGSGTRAARMAKVKRLSEVRAHVVRDVELTRAIYRHGCNEGYVFFWRSKHRRRLKVHWNLYT